MSQQEVLAQTLKDLLLREKAVDAECSAMSDRLDLAMIEFRYTGERLERLKECRDVVSKAINDVSDLIGALSLMEIWLKVDGPQD